ncbi:MAG: LPD38 domain-containing protein [Pyrinomonadaceae bacterium]
MSPEGPKPVQELTVREAREEAKRLGVPQYDNERGQPSLRKRIEEARAKTEEAPKEEPLETEPADTGSVPEPGPVPEESVQASSVEAPEDLRPAQEQARSLLQQDPLKIKWADVSDEALLTAYRESTLGSPIQKALEIQRKARGLEGVGFTESEIRTRMYGQRLRAAERSQIADVVKDIPDDTLGDLAKQFKQGPVSKAVRKEADARGIDYGKPPANPRSSGSGQAYAGAPATLQSAGARIRGRAKAVQSGKLRGSPQSPHRIIAETARKLGMGPVGTAGANALKRITLGFYRAVPEAIRLRFKDDMDVFMHELGHHLHKMVIQGGEADRRYTIRGGKRVPMRATGLDQDRFPAAWHKELDALGRAAYGSKKPAAGYMSEGWAELVRYAFTDQSTAYRLAPTAYTDMVRTLQTEFPEAYRALVNFRHRYQLYHANAPAVKLAGYIRTEGMPKGPMGDQLLDAYDKARIELFDKFQPLVRLKKDIGIDTDKLPADKDPHVLALRAGGRSYGHLQTILEEGRVDFDTGKVVPGKKSLLQIIEPAKDHLDEFDVYMAGKRAIEKRGQVDPKTGKFLHKGVFAGLDDSDLRQAVKDLEREYPHFKQMAQEFQELNEWFLSDYAVKAGLITAKQADTIISQNLHYITFKKVKIDEQLSPARTTSKSRKFSDVKSGIRRFAKFHGEQIDPPLESFIASMQSVINNAQINRMAESLVSLAEIDPTNPKRPGGVDAIGRWIDRIDRPMEMSEVVSDAVRAELEARLKRSGYQNLDPNTIDTILRLVDHDDFHMFRPGMRTDKGSRQIMVLRKGKPTLWEIKDQNLFDMMEGIGNVQSAHLLFRTVRNLYRAGATTLSPEFWLQNFLRDGFQAFVFSGGKLRPGTRAAAWLKAFTTGDPGAMFKASGASMSSLFGEYVNPRTKKIEIDRMFGKKNVIKQSIKQKRYTRAAKEVLSSPFDLIRNINDRFEMANRLAEFEVMLRDKPNPSRADIEGAGQAAADVTLDFQRGGRTSLRVNQYIPFFNAAFQGADKLAREIKKNPPRFFGRMFTYIIAPSLAVHLMNRRDEEYWQLTYQERDRYWHIPLGDPDFDGKKEWIKIPKPYGLGAFSVAVERALARYDGIDPVTGKRGDPEATEAGSLAKGLTDTFRPPYTVPLLTPTFELIANYSIFYGGPIVREAEKHGPIHERGAERSSELAYVLGKLLGVEPPRIDYAINGVFAGLGTDINKYIISPVVKAAREGLGGEVKPQRKIKDPLSPEQWFILNRFLMDEPREYTESNRRFWQTWDEMENTWNGYTSRKDNPARALKYMEDNRPEIMAYKNLLPYKNKMDILYRQLRRTYRSGEWPEKEMYDEQNRLFLEITKTAREAMQRLTTIKKETE